MRITCLHVRNGKRLQKDNKGEEYRFNSCRSCSMRTPREPSEFLGIHGVCPSDEGSLTLNVMWMSSIGSLLCEPWRISHYVTILLQLSGLPLPASMEGSIYHNTPNPLLWKCESTYQLPRRFLQVNLFLITHLLPSSWYPLPFVSSFAAVQTGKRLVSPSAKGNVRMVYTLP